MPQPSSLTTISLAVCDEAFRRKYKGDPVFALKWQVDRYNYELLPMEDGDETVPHLFRHLLLSLPERRHYFRQAVLSPYLFVRLAEEYMALKYLEPHTMRYPTNGAAADLLEQELQAAIDANKELWDCLVPPPSPSPVQAPSHPGFSFVNSRCFQRNATDYEVVVSALVFLYNIVMHPNTLRLKSQVGLLRAPRSGVHWRRFPHTPTESRLNLRREFAHRRMHKRCANGVPPLLRVLRVNDGN
ncbi:hypothetical protein B0H13DRAFT_2660652 [Mycena leptocephala]|nr:hypothetical protein B0H13DRAFT_2660652 [Mycena leptocephala]